MSETTSILSSIAKWFGNLLFSAASRRYAERQLSPVTAVVVPSGSGKSKLLECYKQEFGSISTELYILDVEDAVLKDPKNADVVKQIEELKKSDVLLYNSKMFLLCSQHLHTLRQHLLTTGVRRHIICLVSSNEMKKYLKIKSAHYYAPTKRLFEQIKTKFPHTLDYLTYTRNQLVEKDTYIFNSFEELYAQFCKDLKIERKI